MSQAEGPSVAASSPAAAGIALARGPGAVTLSPEALEGEFYLHEGKLCKSLHGATGNRSAASNKKIKPASSVLTNEQAVWRTCASCFCSIKRESGLFRLVRSGRVGMACTVTGGAREKQPTNPHTDSLTADNSNARQEPSLMRGPRMASVTKQGLASG
jgi:hypothetical protein